MAEVTMKQLLEAGVHFGHQTGRWNPKMRPFIFGERNGIHIIDLRQTLEQIQRVRQFVRDLVVDGGVVLFVGTKKQAQQAIGEAARRASMPYVNFRWLGGMLTNFDTIHKRILYMKELARMEESGEMEALPKKERLRLRREREKLERTLGGVGDLDSLPDAVFVVDVKTEHIAVKEAHRLDLPLIAVVDTNCDPDMVDFIIPGNDDAIRSSHLVASAIASACVEGRQLATARARQGYPEEAVAPMVGPAGAPGPEEVLVPQGPPQESVSPQQEGREETAAQGQQEGG
ncbi:MAG: 30S ribosomal protein S2 [Actinomycetota bacterium]|nr:30S ribosomal protein S2 [Actinomycetota bacterium]